MSTGLREHDRTLLQPDGVSLHYRIHRSPAARGALVLLHGAASNLTRWTEFFEHTSLAASHHLLRLDLRGHAGSLTRGRLGLERWADDIAAVLRQEQIERAVVGGHCLGANIAAWFAARHPGQAAGLILIEPMLRPALTGTMSRLKRLAPLLRVAIALVRLVNAMGLHRRHLDTLDLQLLDREFRQHLQHPGGADALIQRYASPLHDLKTMPTANFLQDLVEVTRRLPLTEIRAPFLALLSGGRTFTDPDITRRLLAALPGGEIQELDAKHWIPTEQPEAMRRAIERWVTALPPRTS